VAVAEAGIAVRSLAEAGLECGAIPSFDAAIHWVLKFLLGRGCSRGLELLVCKQVSVSFHVANVLLVRAVDVGVHAGVVVSVETLFCGPRP